MIIEREMRGEFLEVKPPSCKSIELASFSVAKQKPVALSRNYTLLESIRRTHRRDKERQTTVGGIKIHDSAAEPRTAA
jgi:hypothetical protein